MDTRPLFFRGVWPGDKARDSLLSLSVGRNGQNNILYGSLCMGPQNSISGSYMDVIFELVAHEESKIWISPSHSFINTTALSLVELM